MFLIFFSVHEIDVEVDPCRLRIVEDEFVVAEIYTRKNIFIPLYVGHPNQFENTNFENDVDKPPPSKKAKMDIQNVGIVTIQPAENLIGKRNNLASVTQPLPLIDKVKTEKEEPEEDKIGKNYA